MFSLSIKRCLQILLSVGTICVACGQDRKITPKINPGCGDKCTAKDIFVYIKAEGLQDTLHVFWDFQKRRNGNPVVVYHVTKLNATCDIHWHDNVPTVKFDAEKYFFESGIPELYEYNDLKDIGHFDSNMSYYKHQLKDVSWTLKESVLTESEVMVRAHGVYRERHASGIFDVKLQFLPFSDYAEELPHLIHTANSTLIDMSLVNWTSMYKNSRFAMRLVMRSNDNSNDTMHRNMRKSLDDEHTPGVFEIIELTTPLSYKSDDGCFIQYRPVAYTDTKREVSSSTNIHTSQLTYTNITSEQSRKIVNFNGDHHDRDGLGQEVIISAGLSGDGFYKKHNFTSWSYTSGYGRPPIEGFSLFVVVIIAIGLGVPVLLALSGIVYAVFRRYKQRNTPTRFTDEE